MVNFWGLLGISLQYIHFYIYIYTAGIFIGWMKKTITVLPDLPLLFGCGSSDRQWNDGVKYAPRWKKNQWQFQVSKLEVSTIIFLAHLIGLYKGIYYIYPPIYMAIYGTVPPFWILEFPFGLTTQIPFFFIVESWPILLSIMAKFRCPASINWCSMRY